MKWEYRVVTFEDDTTIHLLTRLNQMGTDEWEAVGFDVDMKHAKPTNSLTGTILLKRPLKPKSENEQLYQVERASLV